MDIYNKKKADFKSVERKIMNKEKCIEVLNDLSSYVEEEWDQEEHSKEIELNVTALDYAIKILKTSTACGELNIDGKRYLVYKPD